MATKAFFNPLLFFFLILLKRLRNPRHLYRKGIAHGSQSQLHKYPSFRSTCPLENLSNQTLVCDVEGALLKPSFSSPFPYFMLVAFEAGGLLRAFILLILYPLICFVSEPMSLKIMVMVSFCGIKKEGFRVGRAVLPKFFLESVSLEGFEVLMRAKERVGVSELPSVMVEGFLKDYLMVETVAGRELKVVAGYYVGLMEKKMKEKDLIFNEKIEDGVVGYVGSFHKSLDHHFSRCKETYLVSEADKRNWHSLPKDRYPKPLIFHDGRLAILPTPMATLAMFMWIPFGFTLAIFRALIALSLPHQMVIPILTFTGMRLRLKVPDPSSLVSTPTKKKQKGVLYVCNHRTLLDPLYLSTILNKSVTAVTYSLSRVSEILSPIKTVRLTRDRERDGKMMEKLLSQGDLVVCPEGTTCREPFLLRFSPLFAELSDDIVPVAMDAHVNIFYGTTASGLKCLDPLFFLMNPFPGYDVELLDKISKDSTCLVGGRSRFEVANHVQRELGTALGFECTTLTRKDKYLILAGNEGVVKGDKNPKESRR